MVRSATMKTLLANARRVMPGGAFTTYVLDEDVDLVIRDGKGSKVYDVEGREYIDCVNGSGPMLIGHAHPEVVEALRRAVECPSNFYLLNERGIELAERLVGVKEGTKKAPEKTARVTGFFTSMFGRSAAKAAK